MPVKAMTVDGRLTICNAGDNIGYGRCNHLVHQNPNESIEDFTKRAEYSQKVMNMSAEEKYDRARNGRDLDLLSKDENIYVRKACAQHRPEEFVFDRYLEVRLTAVRNLNNTDQEIQNHFASDPSNDVRRCLAMNKCCTEETLEFLSDDYDYDVRAAVASSTKDQDIMLKLAKDKNPDVRRMIAKREDFNNPEIFLKDDNKDVLYYLAKNSKMSKYLINDEDSYVRLTAIRNMQPSDLLTKEVEDIVLNDKDYTIRLEAVQRIYENKNDENYLKGRGLDKDENFEVREMYTRFCSEEELRKMINDPSEEVRLRIVRRDKFFKELCKDESPIIRAHIACHSENNAKYFTEDPDPYVRMLIAEKGYCLEKLSKDPNFNVSQMAKRILNS